MHNEHLRISLTPSQISTIECDAGIDEPSLTDSPGESFLRAAFLDGERKALVLLRMAAVEVLDYCNDMSNMFDVMAAEAPRGEKRDLRVISLSWMAIASKLTKSAAA